MIAVSFAFLLFFNDFVIAQLKNFVIEAIGAYTNQDVFDYFNFTPPFISNSGNEQNSSTDAVADGYQDDREDMAVGFDNDLGFDQEYEHIDNNPFQIEKNQVPEEYANDPDMWYAIQASLGLDYNNQPQNQTFNSEPEKRMNDQESHTNPNEDIQDALMDTEEVKLGSNDKKEKTKTPSTGNPYY